MKAEAVWVKGMLFTAKSDSSHAIVFDASTDVGGEDSAPRPMEVCLMSLLACTGMDVVAIMKKMEIKWDKFKVEVIESERAENYPKVFTKIKLLYTVEGEDIPEHLYKKAIKLSYEKYCSITAMLSKTADITYEYRIINKKIKGGE